MLKYERFIVMPSMNTNCYLVWDEISKEALLIDPAEFEPEILDRIKDLKLNLTAIVNTHGHGDHIGGNTEFSNATDAPVMIHEKDAAMLSDPHKNLSIYVVAPVTSIPAKRLLKNHDTIELGKETLQVFHTPGHTTGSICLYSSPLLFSGDTLFQLGVGRTDFPGGDAQQLSQSIAGVLFGLPDDTIVLPGHGDQTTIGEEKRYNPFMHGWEEE